MSQLVHLAQSASTPAMLQKQTELFSVPGDLRYELYAAWVECEVDPSEMLDSMLEELLH